jgi:stress response protein SCP2
MKIDLIKGGNVSIGSLKKIEVDMGWYTNETDSDHSFDHDSSAFKLNVCGKELSDSLFN